ncbi:thiS family protein [Yersinia pseudotuberculosis IP 32953]|uniref:MoaD/ThiS family protein n=1 Tax=Yersinia pseudotuberculosis serotype I (strain IP32953) TaxID=273123 RepID=Q66EY2_YERPS|nr:MoaD/ThiS family protein [Yersinia pseudotuberculosis]CQD50266.1 sulfur transfer protein ThiS [Yersinia intermedia]AJJ02364.1 thiS family protein [Yersinia pseudotuberculosis]AJJ53332.1 thiS family protein [Yersinia pseudotuberculosis IP 32953]AJJ65989.1 thiS family protein [Yersinia pseudotuberculosis PB1/+]AXY35688.1 MoaD/ThiS family protein [Yersinia pseudotuberculosis]
MKFKLSGNLAKFTNYKKELHIDIESSSTLKKLIDNLIEQYPALKEVIYDKELKVKKGYLFSFNGQKINPNEFNEPIKNNDCIDIFTAIAGG